MKTYTQEEFLQIMQKYNSIDRKVIKNNLKQIKLNYGFGNPDIIEKLGFKFNKITSWFNNGNPTIPLFEDCLLLSVTFGFSIEEVIQE